MEKGIQDSSAFLSHPRYFVVNGSHNGDKNIFDYSVVHISIHPSKELCSKLAPGEVGVSLP